MRSFNVVYRGHVQPVGASDHIAARRLGTRHLANKLGAIDAAHIAVVDCELAGYGSQVYAPGCTLPESELRVVKVVLCSPLDTEKNAMMVVFTGDTQRCSGEDRRDNNHWARIEQRHLDTVHQLWHSGKVAPQS